LAPRPTGAWGTLQRPWAEASSEAGGERLPDRRYVALAPAPPALRNGGLRHSMLTPGRQPPYIAGICCTARQPHTRLRWRCPVGRRARRAGVPPGRQAGTPPRRVRWWCRTPPPPASSRWCWTRATPCRSRGVRVALGQGAAPPGVTHCDAALLVLLQGGLGDGGELRLRIANRLPAPVQRTRCPTRSSSSPSRPSPSSTARWCACQTSTTRQGLGGGKGKA
jgi:hypothetical protein